MADHMDEHSTLGEAEQKDAQERAAWLAETGEPPQELLRPDPGAPFVTIEQATEVLRQTLVSLDAKSKALAEVSEERRAEWIRAERAEAERDAALARVAALEAALRGLLALRAGAVDAALALLESEGL